VFVQRNLSFGADAPEMWLVKGLRCLSTSGVCEGSCRTLWGLENKVLDLSSTASINAQGA
jgi:hypothetical protein